MRISDWSSDVCSSDLAWADHAWLPYAVLPAVPAAEPWTSLGPDWEDELFYAGSAELMLHSAETAHYRHNLSSGRPSLCVSLRIVGSDRHDVDAVTADPYEGEALTEGIGRTVEAVPMPREIQAMVSAFVSALHVERPFIQRKRDRAHPHPLGLPRPAPPSRSAAGECTTASCPAGPAPRRQHAARPEAL